MKKHLLIVDDDPNMLRILKSMLGQEYQLTLIPDASQAIKQLDSNIGAFDVVISDMTMDNLDGLKLLDYVKQLDSELPFVMITGYGTIENAVETIKKGAFDYISKPIEREHIRFVVQKAIEKGELHREIRRLRDQIQDRYGFDKIIGKSKKMQEVYDLIRTVANSNSTILIEGESGTGKELVAKAIHFNSPRRHRPFITINCGGLPEGLLESELFGHVKGAFTGAISNKKGLFEEAATGTFFLDEIGDVPSSVQTKLLRVLQEKEFKRLGSNEIIQVDVRLITATNVNLKQAVQEKKFREDLYYRIAVIPIHIPPLRERKEDIPHLVEHFLKKYCEQNNKPLKRLTEEAYNLLHEYEWKGNVRELENCIERAVMISPGNLIYPHHLPKELSVSEMMPSRPTTARTFLTRKRKVYFYKRKLSGTSASLKEVLARNKQKVEREAIIQALRESKGNRSQAARLLGISRGSLYNKMRQLNISPNQLPL